MFNSASYTRANDSQHHTVYPLSIFIKNSPEASIRLLNLSHQGCKGGGTHDLQLLDSVSPLVKQPIGSVNLNKVT